MELQQVLLKHPTYILNYGVSRINIRLGAFKRMGLDSKCVVSCMSLTTKKFERRFNVRLDETQLEKSNLTRYERFGQLLASELECDAVVVEKIIKRCAQVLALSEQNILATIGFLRHSLRFTNNEIKKVIKNIPNVLFLTNGTLQGKVDYLQNDVFGGDFDSMQKVVLKFPSVLSIQPENMQARIDFLLGVVDGNMGRVQRAIVYYPHILGSKLQTLETNAEVLLQHWFQGNNTSFQEGVLKAPNALTRNTELTQRRIEQVLQLGLNYESQNRGRIWHMAWKSPRRS
mmetsp:Transcript_21669/g.60144  ORF Transcript_21669/g.60144 Transcript_21669/m.60144 type:complete len:287 (+) Transcript_21669:2-862(+)